MKTIKLYNTQVHDVKVFWPDNPEKRVISFWVKSPDGKISVMVELARFQLDALDEILSRTEDAHYEKVQAAWGAREEN